MKKLLIVFIALSFNGISQNSFKINDQTILFKTDSSYNSFRNTLLECFNDNYFNFKDTIIDGNYLLISKVLSIGHNKLFVCDSTDNVVRKQFGYSKRRQYLLFGKHWYKRQYYLKRVD